MVKINCGIAGSQGATFSVEIDDSDTVEGLKEVISDKISASTKCDAMALIVFWGRKQDKSWVTAKEVTANAVDTSNLTRMHAAAPLSFFKLSEAVDVEDRLEVDQLVAGESPVGVLVEVPPSPLAFDTSIPRERGLSVKYPHLRREALVERLYNMVEKKFFVVLSAPSGYGKTSLMILLVNQHSEDQYHSVDFKLDSDPTQLLDAVGIDIVKKECRIPADGKLHIFVLDKCHLQYSNVEFWDNLMHVSDNKLWLPPNIRFILSDTQSLTSQATPRPVGLISSKLDRRDFLVSDGEARQLITMENGLPPRMQFPEVVTVIIRECNGLVGALRASINAIHEHFMQSYPQPRSLLGYYLSDNFVTTMDRFFGVEFMTPSANVQALLIKLLFPNPQQTGRALQPIDMVHLGDLTRSGILALKDVDVYEFCSPLAGRFYSKWLFPNRGTRNPETLRQLIKDVIESLSADVLQRSVPWATTFPNEATFQQLFMMALAQNTHPNCCICSELSCVFPSNLAQPNQAIDGRLDLYLNGDLRWGIELLVNGSKIGEHLARFRGKYAPLGLNDYVVVDLRPNQRGKPTRVKPNEKRVTVFFELGEFLVANCYYGTDETQTIQLKN